MDLFGGIMTAIAGAFSVYSSYQSRKANKKAAKASRAAADLETQRKKRELDRLRGSQRVAYAKAGIKLDGTPTAVIEDSAAQGKMDIDLIRLKGDQEAGHYNSLADQAGINAIVGGATTLGTTDKNGTSFASRLWT
ncbi:MAG: hypothetical protein GY832_17575 [Chloroflexi bacterium]|nr:hypothetical protein [Chloroflexota bacterium]